MTRDWGRLCVWDSRILVSQPSPLGKGDRVAVDRVLSYIVDLRRSLPLFFIPLEPYPARSARHLPHAGKATSVVILFLHVSCIRFDDARIAESPYRSLPHWGRETASAVDSVLSLIVDLRRSFPIFFHTAFPIQPPPLRVTSFHRKEGVSTRAPSFGRGCRAQRGGVGFLFGRRSRLLFASPLGKGDRAAVDRVLSYIVDLRRSFPLSFMPLEPYPARFARHLPHAGKALSVVILFPHMRVFVLTMREKQHPRIAAFPSRKCY